MATPSSNATFHDSSEDTTPPSLLEREREEEQNEEMGSGDADNATEEEKSEKEVIALEKGNAIDLSSESAPNDQMTASFQNLSLAEDRLDESRTEAPVVEATAAPVTMVSTEKPEVKSSAIGSERTHNRRPQICQCRTTSDKECEKRLSKSESHLEAVFGLLMVIFPFSFKNNS